MPKIWSGCFWEFSEMASLYPRVLMLTTDDWLSLFSSQVNQVVACSSCCSTDVSAERRGERERERGRGRSWRGSGSCLLLAAATGWLTWNENREREEEEEEEAAKAMSQSNCCINRSQLTRPKAMTQSNCSINRSHLTRPKAMSQSNCIINTEQLGSSFLIGQKRERSGIKMFDCLFIPT